MKRRTINCLSTLVFVLNLTACSSDSDNTTIVDGDTTGDVVSDSGFCDPASANGFANRAESENCMFLGLLNITTSPQSSDINAFAFVVDIDNSLVASARDLIDAFQNFPNNQCDRYEQIPEILNSVSVQDLTNAAQLKSTVSVGSPLLLDNANGDQIGMLDESLLPLGNSTGVAYVGTVVRSGLTMNLKIPGNSVLGINEHTVEFVLAPALNMTTGSIQTADQITDLREWEVNYDTADLLPNTVTNIVQWITTVDEENGATVNYNCRTEDDGSELPVFMTNPGVGDQITAHTSSREMITVTQVGNVLWLVYTLDIIN